MPLFSPDMLGVEGERGIFAACAIMVLLMALCLVSKWIALAILLCFLAIGAWTGYDLFLVKKDRFITKAEVLDVVSQSGTKNKSRQ